MRVSKSADSGGAGCEMDIEEFRERGKEMVEYICEYLGSLERRRVTANVEPGYLRPLLPAEAPAKPESFDAIMRDVESKIMPGVRTRSVERRSLVPRGRVKSEIERALVPRLRPYIPVYSKVA